MSTGQQPLQNLRQVARIPTHGGRLRDRQTVTTNPICIGISLVSNRPGLTASGATRFVVAIQFFNAKYCSPFARRCVVDGNHVINFDVLGERPACQSLANPGK